MTQFSDGFRQALLAGAQLGRRQVEQEIQQQQFEQRLALQAQQQAAIEAYRRQQIANAQANIALRGNEFERQVRNDQYKQAELTRQREAVGQYAPGGVDPSAFPYLPSGIQNRLIDQESDAKLKADQLSAIDEQIQNTARALQEIELAGDGGGREDVRAPALRQRLDRLRLGRLSLQTGLSLSSLAKSESDANPTKAILNAVGLEADVTEAYSDVVSLADTYQKQMGELAQSFLSERAKDEQRILSAKGGAKRRSQQEVASRLQNERMAGIDAERIELTGKYEQVVREFAREARKQIVTATGSDPGDLFGIALQQSGLGPEGANNIDKLKAVGEAIEAIRRQALGQESGGGQAPQATRPTPQSQEDALAAALEQAASALGTQGGN